MLLRSRSHRGIIPLRTTPWTRTLRVGCTASSSTGAGRRWSSTNSQLSIRTGPSEPALFTGTIPEHFAGVVSQHGDRPAVIARSPTTNPVTTAGAAAEEALTYHGLDVLSNRLASSLSSLGVRKGDRVAVSLGNGAPFAALTYALFKLGAVLVPLNPTFSSHQVVSALRHLGATVLVSGAATDLAYRPGRGRSNEALLRDVVGGDLAASPSPSHGLQSEAVPSLRAVVVLDNLASHPQLAFNLSACRALTPYSSLLDGSPAAVTPSEALLPSDIINIQFTSGTTSAPKAAMLSHTSILNNGRFIADRMGLDPSDKIVVPPPLFHCFGSVLGYMASATTGAAILFPSPAFDPVATVKMASDHEATGLYGVATMLVAIFEALDAAGPSALPPPRHLRKGIAAGSSVPESLMRRIYDRLGLRDLVICYGMTETSPVSCMTRPSDPFAKRTSSIGTPMPHTSVKIVSPADPSVVLPVGQRGELAASGYLTMRGYYADQTATDAVRRADPDGRVWVYSGDEASMDADGFVEITGRIKDLIIRGGENIHPLEVENCLFQLRGVNEVSVVGVPDDRLGEAVAAFVVPSPGWSTDADSAGAKRDGAGGGEGGVLAVDGIKSWVKEKLSGHLVPKYVFWTDVYPKTASGKIQKFKLRDQAKDMLKMKQP